MTFSNIRDYFMTNLIKICKAFINFLRFSQIGYTSVNRLLQCTYKIYGRNLVTVFNNHHGNTFTFTHLHVSDFVAFAGTTSRLVFDRDLATI